MITIRGQELTLQPLRLFDMSMVLDSILALSTCKQLGDQLRPEMREHLLNVIGAAVRHHIPDVTADEIEDALTMANIGPVLTALSGQTFTHIHEEPTHVQ